MDFNFSEEQEMLRKMARDFLTSKFPKQVVKEIQASDKGYSPEIWREMAELGWMGLVIPEQNGGSGMGFLELAVLLEEMGRACIPGPFFSTVMLGAYPLMEAGSDAQKQAFLPRIADGSTVFTMAITEADGRYIPSSIQTIAGAAGGEYVINGGKLFVPDASVADYILCAVRTAPGTEADGISIFIVEAGAPGVNIGDLKTIDNAKMSEVTFKDVKVPADKLLGRLNKGWDIVKKTVERAAAGKCCDILGGLEQALEMTVAYARDRKQFDQPIGKFQILQHYCAYMATDVDGLKYITYQPAWNLSAGLPCTKEIAIAKEWAGEASDRVMTLAHQIHGAIGVTIDHDLQYYTKRVKAGASSFGDADYYREIVAQEMGL